MKRYLITVKGISYEVEVEELKGQGQAKAAEMVAQPVPQPKAVPTPAPKPAPTPAPTPAPRASSEKSITCPMPGTILKTMVKPGDSVKRGDVLVILEAMKMENEIFASSDEVIDTVIVTAGSTVNTGDVLITFK